MPLRVAIVTPYCNEGDDILAICLSSVRDQRYEDCRHFLVADGFPNRLVAAADVQHIILPCAHRDNGNLARCVGSIAAASEGYDAIAFLDADNWYRDDHIARLVELHKQTGAAVCTAGRTIHRLDGSFLRIDVAFSDGVNFTDTSCLCIFRPAFDLLPLWGSMPPQFGPICDRVMWAAIRSRDLKTAHSREPTVAFRSQYASDYTAHGETPPPTAKQPSELPPIVSEFNALPEHLRMSLLCGIPHSLVPGSGASKSGEEYRHTFGLRSPRR
jgi:glycosyltransferase involved in cell wall biosynthesis